MPSIHRKIKIVSTFSNELLPDLEELLRYCKEQGYAYDVNLLDKQMYFFSSKAVRKTIDELWPSENDIKQGVSLLSRNNILPEYILANALSFITNRKFLFNHCMLGYVEINIDALGNVRTGCNVFKPVGNILDNDLKTIIDSAVYNDSAKKMFKLACPLCTCGYGISATYKEPWRAVGYVLKRLSKT